MDYGLKGKNVLITGSTSGVGEACARIFAQEGANVIISGRNQKKAETIAADIRSATGVNTLVIAADLSVPGEAQRLFDESLREFGHLDVLVNNAGVWPTSYVKDMDPREFEETIYFNLEVPFLLCQRMVNHLLAADRRGKIINIVSQAAFHGSTTGHAHYASSKAGLVGFTISLAREVADKGINVNAVAPGMVYTPLVGKAVDANREYYEKRIPIGRVAEPREIAYPVVFLASDKSDYLTGMTLDATGGMLMR